MVIYKNENVEVKGRVVNTVQSSVGKVVDDLIIGKIGNYKICRLILFSGWFVRIILMMISLMT